MPQRIALFGGSFDPIHFGHLISARSIAEQLDLQKIELIPSARPPHKKDLALSQPKHRLEMARLAVQGDNLFEISDLEFLREGPSYTIDTVNEFRQKLGSSAELFWIIGADSLPELHSWYRARELVELVQIVTAARPGLRPPEASELAAWAGPLAAQRLLQFCRPTPEIQISSSEIRHRNKEGKSIRYLVPESVMSYIQLHSLYQ